jgi:hypothetical protein
MLSFASSNKLSNKDLIDISKLSISENGLFKTLENGSKLKFLVNNVNDYRPYQYSPDNLQIKKLETSLTDKLLKDISKVVVPSDVDLDKKSNKEVDIGIVTPTYDFDM